MLARASAPRAIAGAGRSRFSTSAVSRDAAHKVVVVGAGSAGLSAAHKLLLQGNFKQDDIAIVDPERYHNYQPGWTLVGGGLGSREDYRRELKSLVDPKLRLYQEAVTSLAPEQNQVTTSSGEKLSYEQLIVAPGVQVDLGAIKGLDTALADPSSNVASIYTYDTVEKVYGKVKALKEGHAIFTQPSTPIKCAGAPQKVMWMAYDTWTRAGLFNKDPAQSKIQIDFMTGTPTMFSVPKYSAVLDQLRQERGVGGHFKHDLVAIEDGGKMAVFARPDAEPLRTSFDLLHVTPRMGPPKFLKESALANGGGYAHVNDQTLQHVKYPNVWAIGDASSLPTSKTAAAISLQGPVLVENVLNALEGKQPTAAYDGYTSCPLITEYGKVLLAEFVYGAQPKETFSGYFGLDQGKPQRPFYWLKKDFFPWMYFNSYVKGTWSGPKGWVNLGKRSYSTQARRFGSPRSMSTSAAAQRNTPSRRPRDPLAKNPNAQRYPLESGEMFIVRPAPSMPTNRMDLGYSNNQFDAAAAVAGTELEQLPPKLAPRHRQARGASNTLTSEQIQEVQRLRSEDPFANTAGKLAKQFGCSPTFVSMVAPAPKEVRQAREAEQQLRRATWGLNKRVSRAERRERRSLW